MRPLARVGRRFRNAAVMVISEKMAARSPAEAWGTTVVLRGRCGGKLEKDASVPARWHGKLWSAWALDASQSAPETGHVVLRSPCRLLG